MKAPGTKPLSLQRGPGQQSTVMPAPPIASPAHRHYDCRNAAVPAKRLASCNSWRKRPCPARPAPSEPRFFYRPKGSGHGRLPVCCTFFCTLCIFPRRLWRRPRSFLFTPCATILIDIRSFETPRTDRSIRSFPSCPVLSCPAIPSTVLSCPAPHPSSLGFSAAGPPSPILCTR